VKPQKAHHLRAAVWWDPHGTGARVAGQWSEASLLGRTNDLGESRAGVPLSATPRQAPNARQDHGFRALLAAIDRCGSLTALGALGRPLEARRLPRTLAGVAWSIVGALCSYGCRLCTSSTKASTRRESRSSAQAA
jgi:hypothetical protein